MTCFKFQIICILETIPLNVQQKKKDVFVLADKTAQIHVTLVVDVNPVVLWSSG